MPSRLGAFNYGGRWSGVALWRIVEEGYRQATTRRSRRAHGDELRARPDLSSALAAIRISGFADGPAYWSLFTTACGRFRRRELDAASPPMPGATALGEARSVPAMQARR
jgi:hypothetical protein